MVNKGPQECTMKFGILKHVGHTWLPSYDLKQKLIGAEAGTVPFHYSHLKQWILNLRRGFLPKMRTEIVHAVICWHLAPESVTNSLPGLPKSSALIRDRVDTISTQYPCTFTLPNKTSGLFR